MRLVACEVALDVTWDSCSQGNVLERGEETAELAASTHGCANGQAARKE